LEVGTDLAAIRFGIIQVDVIKKMNRCLKKIILHFHSKSLGYCTEFLNFGVIFKKIPTIPQNKKELEKIG
jgi:hypothetical protein